LNRIERTLTRDYAKTLSYGFEKSYCAGNGSNRRTLDRSISLRNKRVAIPIIEEMARMYKRRATYSAVATITIQHIPIMAPISPDTNYTLAVLGLAFTFIIVVIVLVINVFLHSTARRS
jgi:hypothetical protein